MLPRGRQTYLYLELLNWGEKDNSLQKCVSQLPTCVLSHLNKPQANLVECSVVSTFKCQVISSEIQAFLFLYSGWKWNSFFKWKKYSSTNCTIQKTLQVWTCLCQFYPDSKRQIITLLPIKNNSLSDTIKVRNCSCLIMFIN